MGESEHAIAIVGQDQALGVEVNLGQDELLEDFAVDGRVQSRLPGAALPDGYQGRRVGIAEMAEMDALSGQVRRKPPENLSANPGTTLRVPGSIRFSHRFYVQAFRL